MNIKRKILLIVLTLLSFNVYSTTVSQAWTSCSDYVSVQPPFNEGYSGACVYVAMYGSYPAVVFRVQTPDSSFYQYVVSITEACPDGNNASNTGCYVPPYESDLCPSGTLMDGDQCTSDPQCPDTLEFTGITPQNPSGCTSLDPSNQCPAGQHPDNEGNCANDDCLAGNYKNPATNQCEPLVWSCPNGTSPNGNQCSTEPDPEPEPDPTCPTGSTYDGFTCTPDDPNPNCPKGYSLDTASNMCVPRADNDTSPDNGNDPQGDPLSEPEPDAGLECPSGTKRVGDQCEADIQCPTGTSLINGICQADQTKCPSGLEFINGICQRSKFVCGDNAVWNGSVCVPTALSTKATCQAGSTLINGLCVSDFLPCPDGYDRNGNQCVKTDDPNTSVPAECPSGTTLSGDKCVTNEPTQCPDGYEKIGDDCELKEKFTDKGCKQEPVCKGGVVMCAIARQGWLDNCGKQQLTSEQVKKSLGYITSLDDGSEVQLADLDTSGYDLPTTCPSPRSYAVAGATFRIDLSPFCSIAEIIGNLLLISASFISIRILSNVT